MDQTCMNVVDTAVKIGLGALISSVSGYLVLLKTQSHDQSKEEKIRFYKFLEEKKTKYVEFLTQSQQLLQSHLFSCASPEAEEYKIYLRSFNDVQIIANDELRPLALKVMYDVSSFIFLRKNGQEDAIVSGMVTLAREGISAFQKYAQLEVTKSYKSV